MSLPTGRTALLLVDLQNDDAHLDYGLAPILHTLDPAATQSFYERVAGVVVPNVRRLLHAFRARGERVVYCQSGALLADGADLFPRRRVRFLGTADGHRTIFHRGEVEYEILDAVRPDPSDIVLHKGTVSAFNSSSLDRILRGMDVSSLVVTGVVTDGCVDSTARDASDLGYDYTIIEDRCGGLVDVLARRRPSGGRAVLRAGCRDPGRRNRSRGPRGGRRSGRTAGDRGPGRRHATPRAIALTASLASPEGTRCSTC